MSKGEKESMPGGVDDEIINIATKASNHFFKHIRESAISLC
jgi:hypothetical protein